jgi:signal transduction histidine kinase
MDPLLFALMVGLFCLLIGLIIGVVGVRYVGRVNLRGSQLAGRKNGNGLAAMDSQQLREVYNLISAITATLKYQRVLDMVLDMSADILSSPSAPAERLVGAVMLFAAGEQKRPELHIGSARRLTPADMRSVLPGTRGLIGSAIENGEAQSSASLPQDPELSRLVALRACKVAYCIPLRAGLDTYGVLLFAHPDPDFFTQVKRELLDIISHQAVIAIQNARLYSDLEQEKERMMDIQEDARKKLARDLHDGPTQSIAAIAMRLNFARRLVERDPKATSEEIGKIEELARRTTKEIRHMLFTLRPLVLESQGLIPALDAMAEKMHETYSQNVIVEADPALIPKIEMGKQTIIFFIAEEAITNARKHAQAAHIWVRLSPLEKDLVVLEVEDDGVGFDISSLNTWYDQRGSLGMVNMRERAELVNGLFQISSKPGQGTTIRVLIPLSEESIDRLRRGV